MVLLDSPQISNAQRLAERKRPDGSPIMYQRWCELLFLHWAFEAEIIQRSLPEGLRVDTYRGKAWVGIVPFSMRCVRPRFLPSVPGLSNFSELNLRTYVIDSAGRPGVWFYSLDATHRIPVWIARTFFHLNYQLACIESGSQANHNTFNSRRHGPDPQEPTQRFSWEREGTCFTPKAGSLEFFLVERYRLYSYDAKARQLWTGQVHHRPYPVQSASLESYSKRLFTLNHVPTPEHEPDSILAVSGVDVSIFPMRRVFAV